MQLSSFQFKMSPYPVLFPAKFILSLCDTDLVARIHVSVLQRQAGCATPPFGVLFVTYWYIVEYLQKVLRDRAIGERGKLHYIH